MSELCNGLFRSLGASCLKPQCPEAMTECAVLFCFQLLRVGAGVGVGAHVRGNSAQLCMVLAVEKLEDCY